jgi:Ca2+-transporting ATPase
MNTDTPTPTNRKILPAGNGKYTGLTTSEVTALLATVGHNVLPVNRYRHLFRLAKELFTEPMLLLLALACLLYFLLGETNEAWMMFGGMAIMAGISLYQQIKSNSATEALNKLTAQEVNVIREGLRVSIPSANLVPGDILLLEEGMNVPADAVILEQHDLTVDESVITGESVAVEKKEGTGTVLMGTLINSGSCIARISFTGAATTLGKIGKSIDEYAGSKSLLQIQIARFVKRLALAGFIGFCCIFLLNYLHYQQAIPALLFALTLAMSVIPEEIPVAFSSFMALGAYKMSTMGIICRQPLVIENLGAVNVFCLDKTGTITENRMEVKMLAVPAQDDLSLLQATSLPARQKILWYARLACEEKPFDAMEKAICKAYDEHSGTEDAMPAKIFEYPLEGTPPMMTHIYEGNGMKTVAGKGAPERIMDVCKIEGVQRIRIMEHVVKMAAEGYRVLAVAGASFSGTGFPKAQDDFDWNFEGLLGLYDPPKPGMPQVIADLYKAGITIKILTGDHPATAMNIAARIGMKNCGEYITGETIMKTEGNELAQLVARYSIFARMFPEAKLKVIRHLKAQGDVVAMTGDGVNDGPALKASSIGIAMGKKGTAIARDAADLVLTRDEPQVILDAIGEGRKIFVNLKKAMRYIISIHIPILLLAVIPVLLGWKFPNIFTPIHIVFLELIMGPTCSVFFEKEPAEVNNLTQAPRKITAPLFTLPEIMISICQGIAIAITCLGLYWYHMHNGRTIEFIRTTVLVTLILSNLLLTFVNRSFVENITATIRYRNPLAKVVVLLSGIFLLLLLLNNTAREIFTLSPLTGMQFLVCLLAAIAGTGWFELYKKIARQRMRAKG